MTLRELYQEIGGDYDQAMKVLRMEKLLDKHIRRFVKTSAIADLIEAGKTMEPVRLFETSHAVKGVCSNLGLTRIAGLASEISEEFRPGNQRTMSDEEVTEKLRMVGELFDRTTEGLRRYEEA